MCTKGSCSDDDRRRALVDALAETAKVVSVGCQSVCEGPVVGVEVDGRLEWFERVRKGKARDAVVRLVGDRGHPELPKALTKRRVPKRAGKLKS